MKWLNSNLIFKHPLIILFSVFLFGGAWSHAQESTTESRTTTTTLPTFSKDKLKGVDSSNRRDISDQELQDKFFKKKKMDEKQQVFLPFFYERMAQALGRVKAQLRIQATAVGEVEVDANAMLVILEQLVVESWMNKFKEMKAACEAAGAKISTTESQGVCWVSFSAFSDPDIKIVFDDKALEIRAHIPPDLRAPRTSSLRSFGGSVFDEVTNAPSIFSSYINVNVNQSFRSGPNASQYPDGREPIVGQFDSGTRIGPVVIEANAHSLERRIEFPRDEPSFGRDDVRGVVDFPSIGLRAQVGDLVYPVKSFQNYRSMAGAAFFSQYSLQSFQSTPVGGVYEVFLSRPSKIRVMINDQLVQTLDLPAGRHRLQDIPFNSGLNDMILEITDDTGRTELKKYSYFSASELLKPGVSEVSYAAGAPWVETAGVRNYDSEKTTVSVFHKYGFSEYLTVGANVQSDPVQTVGGFEFLFSTSLGLFSIEPACSLNADHPSGCAGRLRFVIQDSFGNEKSSRFTAVEATTYGSDFAPLGVREPFNMAILALNVTHSRAISKLTNLNFGLGYQFNQAAAQTEDSYSLAMGASHHWKDGLSANLNFRHTKTPGGSEEISVMAFLMWAFPKERQFITATHSSAAETSQVEWSYQPTTGAGGFATRANMKSRATGSSYGGSVDYTANRARMSVNQEVDVTKADNSQTPPTPSVSMKTTNLQLGTALVFAGGHFSISRPVTDSFAMFVPMENLRDQNIFVNLQKDETFLAQTDWLGSAVDPEIPSYSSTTIILGQRDFKQGATLPQDHFTINPPYRAGYAIMVGTDATVYLKMVIQHEDGTPGTMLAGRAIYLDDTSKEAVTVFTNKKGLVRSEGFRHGRYRLEIAEGDYAPIEFTVPESAGDDFDLGTIKLKERKK